MLPPSFRKVDPSSSPILYYALTLDDAAAVAARRVRRDLPGAAPLHGGRRGAGAGVRLAEVRGADPARPAAARRPEHRDRRGGDGGAERQREPADRHPLGHRQGLRGGEPGAAHRRGRLRRADRGLPRRRAGAARRSRATCVDSVQDTKQASWFNGQRAIVLAIQRQPGTNTVAVAQRVKDEVEQLRPQLPGLGGDGHALRPLGDDQGRRWRT